MSYSPEPENTLVHMEKGSWEMGPTIMGWGGYLGSSSRPIVITGVLLGGRQEAQRQRRRC